MEKEKTTAMTVQQYNQAVDAWSDEMYRFALRSCGDGETGRDIVQEAYAALWQHRQRVEPEKAKHYLARTVALRAKDFWRRSHREQGRVKEEEEAWEQPQVAFDLKEALGRALASLPPLQRAILELREVQGYEYEEISNILSISDTQARTYLFRARVALQKRLKAYGYDR